MTTEDKAMRCLIVDDEAPARDELRYLLEQIQGAQVIGAAATAEEAEMLLNAVDYDVVFLDIRMPGCGGLALAERLAASATRPEIVFTTAYPDHAVDAFELSAADYLLKPFDAERLGRSLEQVAARRGSEQAAVHRSTRSPRPEPAEGDGPTSRRLSVRIGDRTVFVTEDDLAAVSAARGYCYFILGDRRVLTSYNLAELEERLSPRFIRAHRSHMVNLSRVAEVRADYRGGMTLVMDDEASTVIPVSRRMAPVVRKRLGL